MEATELSKKMMGRDVEPYLPLGDLILTFDHGDAGRNYHRQLDLGTAVTTTTYQVGATRFTRDAFISHPHQVLALRLRSDGPLKLNFTARLEQDLALRRAWSRHRSHDHATLVDEHRRAHEIVRDAPVELRSRSHADAHAAPDGYSNRSRLSGFIVML